MEEKNEKEEEKEEKEEEVNELDLSRQAKLIPDEINQYTIKVFGVGSVGSHVARILAKTGFKNIELIDRDKVSSENISPQAYNFQQIGMPKVEAMAEILKNEAGLTNIITINEEINEETEVIPLPDTIYCCFFDSFEARKMLFDKLKDYPIIWVDGRIGMFNMRHYLIDCREKKEVEEYEKTLTHGKVTELACGEKACAPVNNELAGKIVSNIVNYIKGKDYVKTYIGNTEAPANDIINVKIRKTSYDLEKEPVVEGSIFGGGNDAVLL